METILREFRYLDSRQFGEICKLSFAFVENEVLTEEIDITTKKFFDLYVKKKLIQMIKQRERNKKQREKTTSIC